MKTQTSFLPRSVSISVSLLTLAAALNITAQSGSTVPVVTVRATDPFAAESSPSDWSNPGFFVLLRDGPTNMALNVYCVLGGTAANGVDYTTIPNFISIPAGVREVHVGVRPVDDALVEGPETVELRLAPSPLMPPVNYIIGNPSNALVVIEDNDIPPPLPVVTIVATDPVAAEIPLVPPGLGMPQRIDPAQFTVSRTGRTELPLDVLYTVSGTASNGVDYEKLSGRVTIPAGAPSATIDVLPIDDFLVEGTETVVITLSPIACITIYPPPPGCYQVGSPERATAHISDDDPAANRPPHVRLLKPLDGQTFLSPNNVLIVADTVDPDGYVPHVEFCVDNLKIGEQTVMFFRPPPYGQHFEFSMTWTNPPPGRHVLRVLATDHQGATAWSKPIVIWVTETSPLPVVTIKAIDPIASEGTNCWRWVDWPSAASANACRTNTATFVVRRSGPTNNALTVHYCIGGTASNGVDYVRLPGAVTIPAGKRAAPIVIIPLDDNLPEKIETVVLRLLVPPTMAAIIPPYVIGCPGRAAAIIVDNDQQRPLTGALADRCFHLMKPGANSTWWRVECSTDMNNWAPICTIPVADGALHFVDPDADEMANRFYRAVPEPNPPADEP